MTQRKSNQTNERESRKLIEKGESETIEFKKSTSQLERALKSVCSFLNHKGGLVYFGIDNKKILGQEISDQTLKSISQKIRQKIKPEISSEIKVLEITGKKLIEVKVKEGTNKPYYLNGIAYKRVGTENQVIPPEELERIILEKKKKYFDSEICEEASLEDIDEEKVSLFLKEARKQRNLKIPEDVPVKDALTRLKLIKDGKLTNATVLLFGKKSEFIQAEVKCIRFHGNKPVKPYIDFQTIQGNLFDLIDKSEDFVLRNIRKAVWIAPGQIQRREREEYPPEAIREAIVNAVAHRDYSSPSKVQVRIFDDYIEIWNPGRLPEGWTVEKLKEKHESVPSNPLLFKQLFWVKYVEDVGGGTLDMIEKCKEWGLPEPEFEDTGTSLIVTFRKAVLTDEFLTELGLNDRQIKIVKYLREHEFVTSSEYKKMFDITDRQARLDLSRLVSSELIQKRGEARLTRYNLNPEISGNIRKLKRGKIR